MNVHGIRRNVKNVVKNYSDAQIKVREATSNDPWGPSGTLMSEIADLTYNVVAFSEIMQVLWKRLNDHGKNWKHVYKALVLLEYLLKCGSERVSHQCQENVFAIETLKDFQHVEDNKDHGVNVREKAKHLVALLKDTERLKSERSRAMKARERLAQASTRGEFIDKDVDAKFLRHSSSSFDEEMLSPRAMFASDLERVRPQTIGEEELQLQLALAMSKEEADQEERIKRNDELRLQMALTESQDAYDKYSLEELEQKTQSSAMEDLIDVFAVQHNAASSDPWGLPIGSSSTSPLSAQQNSIFDNDNAMGNLTENSPDLISSATSRNCYDFAAMKNSLSSDTDFKGPEGGEMTAQKFLGENANLVNLDTLVENAPPAASIVANPFSQQAANPFHASKPAPPTINEIRSQNSAFSTSAILPRYNTPQFPIPKPDAPDANNPFM